MNELRGAALQPKAVSAGLLMLVGTALALTPLASRQLNVSLALPAVDIEDVSSSVGSAADAVLGAIATEAPARARATRALAPSRSSSARPTGVRSVPIPAPTVIVNSPAVTASEPSVMAGHSGHVKRGHGRDRQKVPATAD